jgi:hypothetical protein
MFTQKIVDSDAFLDMPLSTQSLYFHLNMRADDDGFVNNPKKIQRMIGASEDDLKLLLAKRFILGFENGVVVIKHWRMHNLLRKDRYNPTQYIEEMATLALNDNGSYTEKDYPDALTTTWQPNGNQMATQDSIGEIRIDKESIVEDNTVQKRKRFVPPALDEVKAYCQERKNGVDAERFIDYYTSNGWLVGKNKMKDWKAAVRTWERNGVNDKQPTNSSFDLDDFMGAALERTYGSKNSAKTARAALDRSVAGRMNENAKNGAKTAAEDADIQRRAEELQRKLVGSG